MSQENYFGLARRALLEKDPHLFDVDLAKVEQAQKDRRELMAELNPPVPQGTAKELQRLRRELFNLTERAKSTETYCNNKAGEVKLLEQQLTDAIRQKKAYSSAGNDRAERGTELTIQRLESEMDEAAKEFQRARRVSAGAAADLKAWPHHARVEELQKSLA